MKNKCVFLVVAAVVVMYAFSAHALTLNHVEGTWSNVIGGANVGFVDNIPIAYGNGLEDQIRWGYGAVTGYNSGLGFTGVAGGTSFETGEVFEIGQLRHFNQPIIDAADSVELSLIFAFDDPAGLSRTLDFNVIINETPNLTGDNVLDADIIDFPSSFAPETFDIGGILYTVEIIGFKTDRATGIVDQFISPEYATNSARLYGKITTADIPPFPLDTPEPGTLILLGTGLLSLVALRRKFPRR